MAAVLGTENSKDDAGEEVTEAKKRSLVAAVLLASAAFFWVVTTVGDAAPDATAEAPEASTDVAPPGDNTAPPGGDTAPPGDTGADGPTDDTAPPTNDTAPPADPEAPTNDTAPPTTGTAPPGGNTAPPGGDTAPPADPEAPTDDTAPPTDDTAPPTDPEAPTDDTAPPTDDAGTAAPGAEDPSPLDEAAETAAAATALLRSGSADAEPANPCDDPDACVPAITPFCSGIITVNFRENFGPANADPAEISITTTFTPIDGGLAPVSFTDIATAATAETWRFYRAFNVADFYPEAYAARFLVTIDLAFRDINHDSFDHTYGGPAGTGVPAYVDCLVELDADCANVDASHRVDSSPGWPSVDTVYLNVREYHASLQRQIFAPSTAPGVVAAASIATGAPGWFLIGVDEGLSSSALEPASATPATEVSSADASAVVYPGAAWAGADLLCLRGSVECVDGYAQLALTPVPSGARTAAVYDRWLDDVAIAVAADGSALGEDLNPGYWPRTWTLPDQPSSLTIDISPIAGSDLEFAGLLDLELPAITPPPGGDDSRGLPVCSVLADLQCVEGHVVFAESPEGLVGTPADTTIEGPDPASASPGDLLGFSVGAPNIYGDLSPNGVGFTYPSFDYWSTELFVPDCALDAYIDCVAGTPYITAFSEEVDGFAVGSPASFVSITVDGEHVADVIPDDPYGFGAAVPNDDDGEIVFGLSADNGVIVYGDDLGQIRGLDCRVEITQACVAGVPTFTASRGDADSTFLTVGTEDLVYYDDTSSPLLSADPRNMFHVNALPDGSRSFPISDLPLAPGGQLLVRLTLDHGDLGIEPDAEGVYPSTMLYPLLDCVVDTTIMCVDWPVEGGTIYGQPTIFADGSSTPTGIDGIAVRSIGESPFSPDPLLEPGVAPGTWFAGNDHPDAMTYAYRVEVVDPTTGVVIVAGDQVGPSVDLLGRDCIVDVYGLCSAGVLAVVVDAGNTGIDLIGIDETVVDFSGEPSQTFYPDDGAIQVDLEVDMYGYSGAGLTLNDHQTGPISIFGFQGCSAPIDIDAIECSSLLSTYAGAILVDASAVDQTQASSVAITLDGPGEVIDLGGGLYVVPGGVGFSVATDNTEVWLSHGERAGSTLEFAGIEGIDCSVEVEWKVECVSGAPYARVTRVVAPTNGAASKYHYWTTPTGAVPLAGVAGSRVDGADLFTVNHSSSNELGASNLGAAHAVPDGIEVVFVPASYTVPACTMDVSATATCADGTITVSVAIVGATPLQLKVDDQIVAPNLDGTIDVTVGARLMHTVEVLTGDPDIIVTPSEVIALAAPCQITVQVITECIGDMVFVAVTEAPGSTGTLLESATTVNGDSALPFLIEPGSGPIDIQVASENTLAEQITIPEVVAPESCDEPDGQDEPPATPAGGGPVPGDVSGTVFISWSAACVGDPAQVEVAVQVSGLTLGEPTLNGSPPVGVNIDGSSRFLVAPGSALNVIAVLFNPLDGVIFNGPATAPVCPTPEPEPAPAPPILVSVPSAPIPEPEPTPEPTEEPTPEPTEEPTPEPTEEPAPEDPPGDEPAPAPPVPMPQSLRQHGQSTISLPCDLDQIEIPGVVTLTRVGEGDDGQIIYTANGSELDEVGVYKQVVSCAGQTLEFELFVYHQMGGSRGEANSVSTATTAFAGLLVAAFGLPRLLPRRLRS